MNEGSSTSENGGELFSLYQSHSGERSESVETDAPVKLSDAADSPGKSGYTQEAEFFESDLDQPVDLIDILKDASKCAKKNVLEFHSGGQHMWNLTYSTLYYRAQQISSVLLEFSNRIQWENVALVFPISSYNWFLSALYGCMLTGCTVVPVLVNSDDDPDSLSEIAFIFSSCKIRVAISTSKVLEEIVGVSGQSRIIKIKSTNWLIVDSIDLNPSPNHLAPQNFLNCNVIQFTKGYMDDLKGCVVPVGSLVRQAVNFSTGSKITRNSTILLTLEPRQGLGLFICAVLSVVIGASVIISDEESLNQPGYFLYVIRSQEGL